MSTKNHKPTKGSLFEMIRCDIVKFVWINKDDKRKGIIIDKLTKIKNKGLSGKMHKHRANDVIGQIEPQMR